MRYDTTAHGVLVQVHFGEPTDAEWTKMLGHMLERKDTLRAVLAVGQGDGGPTSRQRAELAETLKRMPRRLPFALLTDSRVARGVLTAINWLTKKQNESRAFPLYDLDFAMTFLGLQAHEKNDVRALVFKLGGSTTPGLQASAK